MENFSSCNSQRIKNKGYNHGISPLMYLLLKASYRNGWQTQRKEIKVTKTQIMNLQQVTCWRACTTIKRGWERDRQERLSSKAQLYQQVPTKLISISFSFPLKILPSLFKMLVSDRIENQIPHWKWDVLTL